MQIEHKQNVFCIITGADTPQGRDKIGRGCWLYRCVEPHQSHVEFGYRFAALDDRMWIVVFVDSKDNQTASFFEETGLLPLFDMNNKRNPDSEPLRLEDKRKGKGKDEA